MYNNVWDQRYMALQSLLESLQMTEELANKIKNDFSLIEENVPERFIGYVDSLIKYNEQLDSLWQLIYSPDEYADAKEIEKPKLVLPPGMTVDENGSPVSGSGVAVAIEDNEDATDSDNESEPGYSQELDVNIGWFGNLVNRLNNYIPEKSNDWRFIWSLIREGMGIANGRPTTFVTNYMIGNGMSQASAYLPLAWDGNRDAYKGEPLPEYVGRPDDTVEENEVDERPCIHEQLFPYGAHSVIMKIYKTEEAILMEVKIAPMCIDSSVPAIEMIGTSLVRDESIRVFENIRVPLLVRGEGSLHFGRVALFTRQVSGYDLPCIELSVVGLRDPLSDELEENFELAANTTYTIVAPFQPTSSYTSIDGLGDWRIRAERSGSLTVYSTEYLGGITPPVPPPQDHILDWYNIGSAVFEEIRANRLVLTQEMAHQPTEEGTGLPLTWENISTGSYQNITSREFIATQEDAAPPTSPGNPDNPLRADNIGTAVLEKIKAKRFVLVHDTNEPQGIKIVAEPQKAPNPYDYFAFEFKQNETCFNVSFIISQQFPNDFCPDYNMATPLFGLNMERYLDGTVDKGDVDVMGYYSMDRTVPFIGLYAYKGDGPYNKVYCYDDRRTVPAISGDPVWRKVADMFTLSVYRTKGILVYSFEPTYSSRGIETWSNGVHKIVTEGEMPRNLMPGSNIICCCGKHCFLTYQANGAVRLTVAEDEAVQPFLCYNTAWITYSKDNKKETGLSYSLPSRAKRGKEVAKMKDLIPVRDPQYLNYEWPGMQSRRLIVDDNGLMALRFTYNVNDLRAPIIGVDGNPIDTIDGVMQLGVSKRNIRITLGDNVVLKIINVVPEKVPGYEQYYTGLFTIYFSICEYVWLRPRIKFVVGGIKDTADAMRRIIQDWDGIKKSEYFEEIVAHRQAIDVTTNLSNTIMNEFNSIYENVTGSTTVTTPMSSSSEGMHGTSGRRMQ